MSDNDNVVRPDAFQPAPDPVREAVASVMGDMQDFAGEHEIRGLCVVMVGLTKEGKQKIQPMWTETTDDSLYLLSGVTLLHHSMQNVILEGLEE